MATTATSIVGVLLLVAGCSRPSQAPPRFEFDGDEIQIPLQFVGGRPAVKVRLNGKGPYLFTLDSGCNTITVSRTVIQQAALPVFGDSSAFTNAAGQSVPTRSHRLNLMELGGARLQGVAVSHLVSLDDDSDTDGILGLSYFADYRVRLDFPGQMLTIRKQRLGRSGAGADLPMKMKHGLPYVPLQIGNQDLLFLVDTGGFVELMIPTSAATNLPCCPERYDSFFKPAGRGGYYFQEGRTRLLENVQIGSHTIVRPYVSWPTAGPGWGFILGNKILRHFAVEFDFPAGRVRFLREETDPIYSRNRRQVPVRLRKDKAEMFVTLLFLRPAWQQATGWLSPCGKTGCDHGLGVRPGDQVIAIEGKAAVDVSGDEIEMMGRQRDQLQFVVRRNGVLLTNDVPVLEDSFSF